MRIEQEKPKFAPIMIVLETQEEVEALRAVAITGAAYCTKLANIGMAKQLIAQLQDVKS